MGVVGAALATVLARMAECSVSAFYTYRIDKKLAVALRGFFHLDGAMLRDFFRVAVPVMMSGGSWGIAQGIQTGILGHMGSAAIAANSIASSLYQVVTVLAYGLASANSLIGMMDAPSVFYLPGRFSAQLIWMQQGFLEYRFSTDSLEYRDIEWLEISFEACSEAPMYRDPWKSDIAVEVNGKRLGVWTCPCDCGGRRGLLTPEWWSETSTQFGFLKIWRVDQTGAYLDNQKIGETKLSDLAMENQEYISVRIGVPADAEYVGGLNLFGDQFGDYAQNLVLRVGYRLE